MKCWRFSNRRRIWKQYSNSPRKIGSWRIIGIISLNFIQFTVSTCTNSRYVDALIFINKLFYLVTRFQYDYIHWFRNLTLLFSISRSNHYIHAILFIFFVLISNCRAIKFECRNNKFMVIYNARGFKYFFVLRKQFLWWFSKCIIWFPTFYLNLFIEKEASEIDVWLIDGYFIENILSIYFMILWSHKFKH